MNIYRKIGIIILVIWSVVFLASLLVSTLPVLLSVSQFFMHNWVLITPAFYLFFFAKKRIWYNQIISFIAVILPALGVFAILGLFVLKQVALGPGASEQTRHWLVMNSPFSVLAVCLLNIWALHKISKNQKSVFYRTVKGLLMTLGLHFIYLLLYLVVYLLVFSPGGREVEWVFFLAPFVFIEYTAPFFLASLILNLLLAFLFIATQEESLPVTQ